MRFQDYSIDFVARQVWRRSNKYHQQTIIQNIFPLIFTLSATLLIKRAGQSKKFSLFEVQTITFWSKQSLSTESKATKLTFSLAIPIQTFLETFRNKCKNVVSCTMVLTKSRLLFTEQHGIFSNSAGFGQFTNSKIGCPNTLSKCSLQTSMWTCMSARFVCLVRVCFTVVQNWLLSWSCLLPNKDSCTRMDCLYNACHETRLVACTATACLQPVASDRACWPSYECGRVTFCMHCVIAWMYNCVSDCVSMSVCMHIHDGQIDRQTDRRVWKCMLMHVM